MDEDKVKIIKFVNYYLSKLLFELYLSIKFSQRITSQIKNNTQDVIETQVNLIADNLKNVI